MASYNLSLASTAATGTFVQDHHFGTNALHDINISKTGDFQPHDGFAAAVDGLDLTHLRYPGGHAENTIDITRLENGQLRAEVRAFMDWVVANSSPDHMMQVTVVLPTKVDVPAAQVEAFVYLLMETYGDHVSGLEIGNEYSIGKRVADFDRSTHPEDNPDSDFVSSMTETEYGIAANRVINAAQKAIDRLAADRPDLGHDPAMLIQLGDTNGAGSAYKGNGSWDEANEAILAWLDQTALDAIDGAVGHYYYNQQHMESLAFEDGYQKIRSLDQRIDNFNGHLGRDVPLYITEWNVLNANMNQQGMAAASTLLEMFEFMVQEEVADAFIWPLQHRTSNTIGGNRGADGLELSAGGGAFRMMSDTLRPETSAETGHVERFQSIRSDWTGTTGAVEVNGYASAYHDVLFVSLRDLDRGTVTLDITPYLAEAVSVDVVRLTMDPASSDGLSDLADDEGLNRIGRRYIDAEELDALSRLAFFDPDDKNHLHVTNDGQYRTYLPPAYSIVPLVANPQSISDYYFATEVDVAPMIVDVSGNHLDSGSVRLDMMPYDVARITIEKKWVQEGGAGGEVLTGGIGQDVVLGREGDDTITTGEGDDTVKGGYGNDLLDAGSGHDSIVAGDGDDTILAGAGDDLIVAGTGTKTIYGGAGQDTVRLISASTAYTGSLMDGQLRLLGEGFEARIVGVETLQFDDMTISVTEYLDGLTGRPGSQPTAQYGTALGDRLVGTSADELLIGNSGGDVLIGNGGRDTLIGGDGDDLLIGEERGLYSTDASAQVYRIYKAVFGREPDVDGHQHWVSQLASSSMSFFEIAQVFMSSPEFRQTYGTTTDREFVTLLYNNVLLRAPASDGLDFWLGRLGAGMSRDRAVQLFAESGEHQSRTRDAQTGFDTARDPADWTDAVFRLFQAVLDRVPDAGGFEHWVNSLARGTEFDTAVGGFMNSPEFQATYGSTTNAQFVTLLYQNVLDRTPDAGGLATWTGLLDGGRSRTDVVKGFMASAEFITNTDGAIKSYMHSFGLDDVLEAGSGNDILSGGLYCDAFVFDPGDDGSHLVTDLEPWDLIDVSAFGYADVGTARARLTQQGDDVVFQDQGVTVVFSDVTLHEITDDMLSLV